MILLFTSLLLSFTLSSPSCPTVQDVLRAHGLPVGLLPKEVDYYTLQEDGRLEVHLVSACYANFESRVHFEAVVKANLSYGSLGGLEGLKQEELFLWLPVKDIVVKNPDSGVIIFDIGVAFKQISLSIFEEPPKCNPDQGKQYLKLHKKNKIIFLV